MEKRISKYGLAICSAVLAGALFAPAAYAQDEVVWFGCAGENALDTMSAAVLDKDIGFAEKGLRETTANRTVGGKVDTVVVVSADGWWDALSSEGLAGIDGAPVLVTDSRTLSSQTKHVIETLGAKRAVVVGGPESVSDSVVSDLEALLGSRPERVAGADAQATSRAVYHARDTWAKTAFVATSSTFQDALSVAPYAYAKGCPVILAGSDGLLSAESLEILANGGFDEVVIAGGPLSVPDSELDRIKSALGASCTVSRLFGDDAVATCAAVIDWGAGRGYTFKGGAVADARGWYDALVGAACSGRHGMALALVDGPASKSLDAMVRAQRTTDGDETYSGFVFGGYDSVSKETCDHLPLTIPTVVLPD